MPYSRQLFINLRISTVIFFCLLVICDAPLAYANEDLSTADGGLDGGNNNVVNVSYIAYDTIRFPDQGGYYCLPTPSDPLRFDVELSSIPPTQEDIAAHYKEFDGYVFLTSDYYDGVLGYVYYWHEMDHQEAEQMFRQSADGRPSEGQLAEEKRLYEAGDWDNLFASEDDAVEHNVPTRTQEELMAEAKEQIQEQMDQAMAGGDLEEVGRLKEEKSAIEQEEREYAERSGSDGDLVADADQDSSASGFAIVVIGVSVIAMALLAYALIVAVRRGKSKF